MKKNYETPLAVIEITELTDVIASSGDYDPKFPGDMGDPINNNEASWSFND